MKFSAVIAVAVTLRAVSVSGTSFHVQLYVFNDKLVQYASQQFQGCCDQPRVRRMHRMPAIDCVAGDRVPAGGCPYVSHRCICIPCAAVGAIAPASWSEGGCSHFARSISGQWLQWSRNEAVLCRALELTFTVTVRL
jgi:hypothetical protein